MKKEKKVVKAVSCWIVLRKIMKWINILFSLAVVGLGIYKYTDGNFNNFADVFIPFYLIGFGVLLIFAEAEWIILIKHFKFLDNYFGRGFYNIFLGTMLLNIISINTEGDADRNVTWVLVVIVSSTMAFVGVMEIFLYICHCGATSKTYAKYDEKQDLNKKLLKEEDTQKVSQNVRSEIDIRYSMSLKPQNSVLPQQQQMPNQDDQNPAMYYTSEQIYKMQQNPEEYSIWLKQQLKATESKLPLKQAPLGNSYL
ncbi:unnamed protein product [Paramecium sonneborni]|uniref:Uncharacterized protein n=1 Tax=Paramecium sonneborni TaxID=65129 RepID=A0A8S1KLL7_9CILI|nr:unnamed protein product [Paramecium sonneborni]CAD8055899.1 unnamed protein product [Paramecium sonneborni]CAD8055901.1 unnamed protein product [Paramecium sonneborni]CAD8055902.1 unnamed protein product [Paramecium sonneborni]